jgi:Lrp/AsnC family leucine-responsive transcriptional regulator
MVDSIDKEILSALEKDARLPYAEIGRQVGLSSAAVRDRVLKMEDLGIIRQFCVNLNQKLLGNDLEVIILVKVFHGKLKSFLKMIPKLKEVQNAYRITGNQNVHLKLVLRNQTHLQSVIEKLMIYGDTETMLILSDILE